MERNDHTAGNHRNDRPPYPGTARVDSRRVFLRNWIAENEGELFRGLRPLARMIYNLRGQDVDETQRELLVELAAVAITKAENFDSDRDPRLWLLGIARNIVKQWRDQVIKANHRLAAALPSPAISEDTAVDMLDRLHAAQRGPGIEEAVTGEAWVKHRLAPLKPDEERLVRIMAIEGYSAEEAGTLLNLSPGNARVKLHRILKRLRAFEVNETIVEGRFAGGVAVIAPDEPDPVQRVVSEAKTSRTTP